MMLECVLVLSAYLFSIGIYRLITSRNMVRALMCLELILNAVNMNFVTFSYFFDSRQLVCDIFSIFVIAPLKWLLDQQLFPQFIVIKNQLAPINQIF